MAFERVLKYLPLNYLEASFDEAWNRIQREYVFACDRGLIDLDLRIQVISSVQPQFEHIAESSLLHCECAHSLGDVTGRMDDTTVNSDSCHI